MGTEPWELSERQSAKTYGKRVAASGSGVFEKLDILGMDKWKGWRGENKATKANSFSLTVELLKKGMRQARIMNAKPFYIIDFHEHNERFIVVREQDWIQLFQLLEEKEDE